MPVYFVHNPSLNAVKVGTSSNVPARLAALKTASPTPLCLLGTAIGDAKEERRIHRDLAEYRLEGEWFSDHPVVMTYIQRLLRPLTVYGAWTECDHHGEVEDLIGVRCLILSTDETATVTDAIPADGVQLCFIIDGEEYIHDAKDCVLLAGWPLVAR